MSTLTEALRLQIDEVAKLERDMAILRAHRNVLARMLRDVFQEANSRGALDTYDKNTTMAHLRAEAREFFADIGLPPC